MPVKLPTVVRKGHNSTVTLGSIRHRQNLLRCYRVAVGLGCPPAAYTTNASESINALIKHEEIVRSVSGRGLYRLTVQYSQLELSLSFGFE